MLHEKIRICYEDYEAWMTTYFWEESKELYPGQVRPVILICPGGAYRMTSDREAEAIAIRFMSMGYHGFYAENPGLHAQRSGRKDLPSGCMECIWNGQRGRRLPRLQELRTSLQIRLISAVKCQMKNPPELSGGFFCPESNKMCRTSIITWSKICGTSVHFSVSVVKSGKHEKFWISEGECKCYMKK